jgi:3-oxoadipate enol-lactonase
MSAVPLHFETTGPTDAPVVLLLGSLGSTLAMWDPQAEALAERFRVVRCDTRGHGQSPVPPGPYSLDDLADDALGVLDAVGARSAHVVGLSLGGVTALRLAARNPDRVDRLVVLCTAATFADPSSAPWQERAALVRAEGAGAVADMVVGRWFTDRLKAEDPELVQRIRAMIAATPAEGYAGCCDALTEADVRADLGGITAPTLVVAAAQDPASPLEKLQAIADGVPGARLLVVDDAAHLVNLEQPAAVTAALLEHLRESALR